MNKIHGIGINDADYSVFNTKCKVYRVWNDMLSRCYSKRAQERQPTYIGCTVAPEWWTFSVFRNWYLENCHLGEFLDKDLLSPDCKVYGPETCLMVSRLVNNLFTLRERNRGVLPCGVSIHPKSHKFFAYVSVHGKKQYVGAYDKVEEAANAYKKAKQAYVLEVADTVCCPKTKSALIKKAEGIV